jgi:hypothetical protein
MALQDRYFDYLIACNWLTQRATCRKVCHVCSTESAAVQSQWEYDFNIACFCTMCMQNTTSRVVVNLYRIFLMAMLQTRKQFSNTWKGFDKQVPILGTESKKNSN